MITTRSISVGLLFMIVGASSTAAQTKLEVAIGGGYAVVVSDGHQSVDIGPIKKPGGLSSGYMLHHMRLGVEAGLVDQKRTTLVTEHIGVGSDPALGWDLTGKTIEFWVNGAAMPKANVGLPQPSPLSTCDDATAVSNNRNFLPDILALSGSTALVSDWKTRLNGRLTLHGGTLGVNRLAPGCFTFFQKSTATNDTRRLADGQQGLLYSTTLPVDELTIRVSDSSGRVIGNIVMKADAGAIRLTLNTHDTMNPKANTMIEHFKYFYTLVDSSKKTLAASPTVRPIPKWLGVSSTPVTPGEACPPGYYEVP